MRDISLHILDLIENSIKAKASTILVSISEDVSSDTVEICVEDNGCGLKVSPEKAVEPFYTTKPGKKTGLGLSLLRAAAERADGFMVIGKSELGGLSVKVTMKISHLDRTPFGNLPATISSIVCTNPDIDLNCRLSSRNGGAVLKISEVTNEFAANQSCGLIAARVMADKIRKELENMRCYKDSATIDQGGPDGGK